MEGRPTAILGHRVIMNAGGVREVILARQYYVGHFFCASRSFIDQVAGLGSRLKHSIRREQMKG